MPLLIGLPFSQLSRVSSVSAETANIGCVEVESVEEKLPGKELYYKDTLIAAEKYTRNSDFYISQYLYDENNRLKSIVRICENSNWDEKYIEYSYNKNNLPEKKISYRDATIYKNRYE